jgi:hypothetical protein
VLEILIVWKLCARIGRYARARAKNAYLYQSLVILFWILGEIAGSIAYGITIAIYAQLSNQGQRAIWLARDYFLCGYVAAFLGAAIGAWIAFRLVKRGSPLPIEGEQANGDLEIDVRE